jgi:hypothetical protein
VAAAARNGIVASFDMRMANMMIIMGCVVVRPPQDDSLVHILMPLDKRSGDAAVKMTRHSYRVECRVAKLYTAATGIKVSGSTQRTDKRPKTAPVPEPDQPVEDDAAGLRRVIGETMEAAGL